MKTSIVLLLALLVSSAALAQVVTIPTTVQTRHEDGSVTLACATSAIPASSRVDLAVLRIKQGTASFAQGEMVELLNEEGRRIAISRVSKTTALNEGRQALKFLITEYVRSTVSTTPGSHSLTVKSMAAKSAVNVSDAHPEDLELVVYCTGAN